MTIEPNALAALKQTHGEIWTLTISPPKEAPTEFAFKRPDAASYERYIGTIAESKKEVVSASRRFSLDVLVHPEETAVVAFFDRYPGTVSTVANEAALVCQAKDTDEARKA